MWQCKQFGTEVKISFPSLQAHIYIYSSQMSHKTSQSPCACRVIVIHNEIEPRSFGQPEIPHTYVDWGNPVANTLYQINLDTHVFISWVRYATTHVRLHCGKFWAVVKRENGIVYTIISLKLNEDQPWQISRSVDWKQC